ncbi:SDR family oxidoreductase [Mucilaginibacter galii]|uniref:Short-chain dehydrogenase/reductase n=1 Tax=Mucilaginibacter galii TaxID=2005073 RepID=A0A917MZV7_9SPHI|nr:SDR family oxidoreductase [Mucilaginibacter galii]GGI49431.1 short-chain dehydrogenase/reductase [Mucilaginibacter galii]
MKTQDKVWFVTGASKGLGLSLVKKLLAQGFKVAATSRNADDLRAAINNVADVFLPLTVNLKSEDSVSVAINETVSRFGQIDVVVNNAGYGLIGSLEELTDAEARENFDINVFGSLNVIRYAMPHLRAQKSGHIYNVSSIGGFTGSYPGFGIYCATKFAVHGFTESLAAEVKDFGITATVVSPGYFRTEFLSSGSVGNPENEIAEYESVRQSQQFHNEQMNGQQPGDPDKAADVLIEVASTPNPPVHLFLGSDAYGIAYDKIDAVKTDLENWKHLTTSTDITA